MGDTEADSVNDVERNNPFDQQVDMQGVYQQQALETPLPHQMTPMDYYGQLDHMYVGPDNHYYFPEFVPTESRYITRNNMNGNVNFDYNTVPNSFDGQNNTSTHLNSEIYNSGGPPPPGFMQPLPMEYYQIPQPPYNGYYNIQPQWVDYQPQMMGGTTTFLPGPPPIEPLQYGQQSYPPSLPISHGGGGWQTFEVPKTPLILKHESGGQGLTLRKENNSDDPWWRSTHTRRDQKNVESSIPIPSNNIKFGNYGGGYGEKQTSEYLMTEERFQNQLVTFVQLPMDIHRKIQKMPGSEITNYFEVKVVRFRLENIIESNLCHIVFTKKPETGQCWLMAFSVKDHFRTAIKFNRLLTSHLKVRVIGKTAIELEPSKGSQNHEGEFYLFNFSLENEAEKFIHVLDNARSQIWNHECTNTNNGNNTSGSKSFSQDLLSYRFYPYNFKSSKIGLFSDKNSSSSHRSTTTTTSSKSSLDNVLDSYTFRESIQTKIWPPSTSNGIKIDESYIARENPEFYNNLKIVKFNTISNFFVKCGNDYTQLGNGELMIVNHENYFDELILFVESKKVICHHYIYQWNKLEFGKVQNTFIFKWNAAAYLRNSPSELPLLREFKAEVDLKEILPQFYKAFSNAVKKGRVLALSSNY